MTMHLTIRFFLVLFLVAFGGLAIAPAAQAQNAQNNTACTPTEDPSAAANNGGVNIIHSVFDTINNIMGTVAQRFYQGIVQSDNFKAIIVATVVLYIGIYGLMVTFNMATHGTGEIVGRLARIGFIAMMLSPQGWITFHDMIANPLLGAMNQLIGYFAQASGNDPTFGQAALNADPNAAATPLQDGAVRILTGPIAQVFAAKFFVALISIWTVGPIGWLMDLFLIWALIEFIFMVIGAIATYVKSIVGLAFLFGIAPIFIICLLFHQSRQIFFGWLNQVIGFLLQPVLLFAFLAFYAVLINNALTVMLYSPTATNFCYSHWFSLPGGLWDIWWWRPTVNGAAHDGDWTDTGVVGTTLPPPITMSSILYFLLLCHLGKSFSKFIQELSRTLTQGIGPGMVAAGDVGRWFQNNLANTTRFTKDVASGTVNTFKRSVTLDKPK